MPEIDNLFTKRWQEIIRTADIQKQLWFLAAVFGGKNPVVVDATKIEIKYDSDKNNYIIRSKGKPVEIPGEMLSILMDRMVPESPKAGSSSNNTYGAARPVNQYGVTPRKKAETYGVAPKKKTVQEHYGPVPRVKNPNEGVMGSVDDVVRPALNTTTSTPASEASTPDFNPVTTSTQPKSALSKAAANYGSVSSVTEPTTRAAPIVKTNYASMPKEFVPPDDLKDTTKPTDSKTPKKT
ncbi:MAG: hypothetical protein AB7I18_13630 [Candidatus Berkiella sp.]